MEMSQKQCFPPSNCFQSNVKLERYSESIGNSENEEFQEALLTEVVIPRPPKQAKQLPESRDG